MGLCEWKSRDGADFSAGLIQGLLLHFPEMLLALLASMGGLPGLAVFGHVWSKRTTDAFESLRRLQKIFSNIMLGQIQPYAFVEPITGKGWE